MHANAQITMAFQMFYHSYGILPPIKGLQVLSNNADLHYANIPA